MRSLDHGFKGNRTMMDVSLYSIGPASGFHFWVRCFGPCGASSDAEKWAHFSARCARRCAVSIPNAEREELVAGAVQHADRFDVGPTRLRNTGASEQAQGAFFCGFEGIRPNRQPLKNRASLRLGPDDLDVVDFRHETLVSCAGVRASSMSRRLGWLRTDRNVRRSTPAALLTGNAGSDQRFDGGRDLPSGL